jgi:hypothetical protein
VEVVEVVEVEGRKRKGRDEGNVVLMSWSMIYALVV